MDAIVTDLPIADRIARAPEIRFIRFGKGSSWAQEALAKGTIPLKFRNVGHAPCLAGDWDEVRRQLAASGRNPRAISNDVRELKAFYEFDECLWVTLCDGHLWWAFSEGGVEATDETGEDRPARFRKAADGWRRTNLNGEPLRVHQLSSALTKVASYQRTICKFEDEAYLVRKLLGESLPTVARARQVQGELQDLATQLIQALDWRDFEIFIDLLFTRGGWQRVSAVGDGEADLDLLLVNPALDEEAWVQVKSRAGKAELADYLARFRRDGAAQRFYFICHTPVGDLSLPNEPGLHLWSGTELARKAIAAGLVDWLIARTR